MQEMKKITPFGDEGVIAKRKSLRKVKVLCILKTNDKLMKSLKYD